MRRSYYSFYIILFIFFGFGLNSCIGVKKSLRDRPDLTIYDTISRPEVIKHNDSLFTAGNNFLTKNKFGQWELYIEGNAFERGLLAGALMDSLLYKQEHIFFNKIEEFVPDEKKQKRIIKFLRWYNRKLYQHIPEEYKAEIYGLSRYSSHDFDFIAPPYVRNLYLHGAHDIGHALVDLAMIGCTSSALWGEESEDGKLILGRVLDFNVGEEFAEEKVILFVNPDEGIPFVSVTWPGFLGVVSGMNKEGLTVTMNAGKSKIPLTAKEPISIVARKILQYASTIEAAIAIAKESEVFVSEALMIGSAHDNRAVLIEMSPKNFGVYEVSNSRLVCSNHFQSEAYKKDKRNANAIENSHTQYRFDRMNELIDEVPKVNPKMMVDILRNKEGLKDIKLGYGNEKAINQLVAHHGIVFKPHLGQVWISSHPYQLGAFTAYDLNEVFKNNKNIDYSPQLIDSMTIEEDDFIYTEAYKNYEAYKVLDKKIDQIIRDEVKDIDVQLLDSYRNLNPDMWLVHYKAGLILYNAERYEEAKNAFEEALKKEITTLPDEKEVKKILRKTDRKIK